MNSTQTVSDTVRIRVENIGGINDTEVAFSPGVTALSGRNATNRTSLLRSIMAALGSEDVSLKGDADEGFVELTIGDEIYTRRFTRQNGAVVSNGNPYLSDSELADLYSFLLESNEARRAVARGDDLRELIMRPVDTDEIQANIDRLEQEKRDLDGQIDELEGLESKLPELERERTRLTDELEEKREEIAEKEAEIDATDTGIEESREEKAALEEKLRELRETRTSIENARFDIETQRESVRALEAERDELEATVEDLPEEPIGELEEVNAEIGRLRDRKQAVDSSVNELQSILQFNEEMLEGTSSDVLAALRRDDDGSVTDKLLDESETVVCWTCGTEVSKTQIEETLDRLRELRKQKLDDRTELQTEIDELSREKSELESTQHERDEAQRRLGRTEDELEERRERLEHLTAKRDDLEEHIQTLESEVEELEGETYKEILDLHKTANQLEFESGKLQNELERVESEITRIEKRLDEKEQIETEREQVQAELANLRTRVEQIETQAISEFNERMETVLNLLDYANLERIWIERVERQVREGRRKVDKTTFDLHVIRSTDDGATYEDTINHLSESEREVTGLVFALAGYLVHEVYETVPFMLLDSLEAIDSQRIAMLIDYFGDQADYVVAALLPEYAEALDDKYERVTEI
ncbi:MAG: archaea-specific SMC-related protein [Halobacteriota archaeon]